MAKRARPARPMKVRLERDRVHVGERFSVSFQRTLRIPDDGGTYPLPPGLGLLPVHAVAEHTQRVPESWKAGEFFIPMYQREALWLGFDAAAWKPNAVKVGVGGIDAISGETWHSTLQAQPQNYIVCPDQPWLDGINAGPGVVRQFVAMPLGAGYTIEGQLSGEETVGGIQLRVFEPKPGRFPDRPPREKDMTSMLMSMSPAAGMGLAAGGRMTQAVYKDVHGLDTWDSSRSTAVVVHIVNSSDYKAITGHAAPATPVSARTYTEYGLPWFALYDEAGQDIEESQRLASVKSTGEIDKATSGRSLEDDRPIDVADRQVRKLRGKPPFAR